MVSAKSQPAMVVNTITCKTPGCKTDGYLHGNRHSVLVPTIHRGISKMIPSHQVPIGPRLSASIQFLLCRGKRGSLVGRRLQEKRSGNNQSAG